MAKHVAREKRSRRHRTVDRNERLLGATAAAVDRSGDQLLAGAARPHDEHTRLVSGDQFDRPANLIGPGGDSHDPVDRGIRPTVSHILFLARAHPNSPARLRQHKAFCFTRAVWSECHPGEHLPERYPTTFLKWYRSSLVSASIMTNKKPDEGFAWPGDAGRRLPTLVINGENQKKNDPWAGSERNDCNGTAAGRRVGDCADGRHGLGPTGKFPVFCQPTARSGKMTKDYRLPGFHRPQDRPRGDS